MKKLATVVVGLAIVLCGEIGPAAGQTVLHITGWMAGGGGASISAKVSDTQTLIGTYGVGAFQWQRNGVGQSTPLYCLDIFHSFGWGDTWNVQEWYVPPDPPFPPPYNTGEAVWIYQKYGKTTNAVQAQATQIALWEISHQEDWRAQYENPSGWWATGNFKYTSGNTTTRQTATTILSDLYANYQEGAIGQGIYYQPLPYTENNYYKQGQIGEAPEPSVLVLLGTGLLSITGASWRRRKRT
jgi:hypothetical protein